MTLHTLHKTALRRPRTVIAVVLAITAAVAPGIRNLRLRTDGHALVPHDDPAIVQDGKTREIFGIKDPIVIAIESRRSEKIFNVETMMLVDAFTRELADIEGISRDDIVSLATERRNRVRPGTLDFRTFLEPMPTTPVLFDRLKYDLDQSKILYGTIVSNDRRSTAVLVGVEPYVDRRSVLAAIDNIVVKHETPTHVIRVVGAPVAEVLLGDHILQDLALLVPIAVTVVSLLILLMTRNAWTVFLAMTEVGACLVFTFALMASFDIPVYLTTAVLPVILTALGIADEIHIFSRYQANLAGTADNPAPGGDRFLTGAALTSTAGADAAAPRPRGGPLPNGRGSDQNGRGSDPLAATMDELFGPVVKTSVTSAVAFLSFALSPIDAVRYFGIFAAVGIMFCMFWSLTVIPAALALIRPARMMRSSRPGAPGPLDTSLASLGRWVVRRKGTALVGIAVLIGLTPFGIARVFIQDSWIDGFAESSKLYQDTQFVNGAFFGSHLLQIHCRAERMPSKTVDCAFLKRIGGFEDHLAAIPGVGGVLGAEDHLATMNFLIHLREDSRTIPDEQRELDHIFRQLLRIRGPRRAHEIVSPDRKHALVTVFLKNANFRDTAAIMKDADAYAAEHLAGAGIDIDYAGDVAVSQAMIPAIVATQKNSLLLSLVVVLIVTAGFGLSPMQGVYSMLPAAFAVAANFAAMGYLRIPLGVATSMFCAITIGVGVDYAIHLIDRCRTLRRACDNETPVEETISQAVATTGPAILTDAFAIAAGFGTLAFSQVPANSRLGILVACSILACAVMSLIGLPALLVLTKPRFLGAMGQPSEPPPSGSG